MRVSAQRVSQRSRYVCASSRVSKRKAAERGLLRVTDAGFDLPFAIGIADAARERDDPVVSEHVAIERIEPGVVDVGREHALFQIVEAPAPVELVRMVQWRAEECTGQTDQIFQPERLERERRAEPPQFR
jgi:hypothetical protein